MLPWNFIDYANSIIYTLFFGSNIFFYNTEIIYHALDAKTKPLLHTWSLSIEEQFYIFFPFLLFILIKFFKKFSVYFLILVSTLSIGLSYNFIDSYPSKTFYLIYFRIWELLLSYFSLFRIKI